MITRLQNQNPERGVALLFAILLSSSLLIVALGITNVAYREATFAIEARDSEKAFFAADNGMECGLYLDGLGAFDTGSTITPACNGVSLSVSSTGGATPVAQFIIATANNTCAQVKVNKTLTGPSDDGSTTVPWTEVTVYGFNMPPASGATTSCFTGAPSPRTVSRALKASYISG